MAISAHIIPDTRLRTLPRAPYGEREETRQCGGANLTFCAHITPRAGMCTLSHAQDLAGTATKWREFNAWSSDPILFVIIDYRILIRHKISPAAIRKIRDPGK